MTKSEANQPLKQRVGTYFEVMILLGLLALLLWNFDAIRFHEVAWIIFFFGTYLIRLPYMKLTEDKDITVDKKTLQERILLTVVFISMGPLPVGYLATKNSAWDVLSFANYSLLTGLALIGMGLVPIFAFLFWRAHTDLGRNWSPTLEMHREHTIVTNGVYSYVRHPMYSALVIGVIAQPLLIHNWIAGGMIVVAFLTMLVLRIPKEEAMLLEEFGDEYREYMGRTGRLIPKLH